MNVSETSIDDRAESFLQIGTVAKKIAEAHCGITVDDTTHRRWSQLMGLLREVDTLADDSEVSHDEVLGRLDDFSEFRDRYGDLDRATLGEDARTQLLARTERILRLGTYIARATTMQRFTALRIVEARETALFLADAATEVVREQTAFSRDFIPTMQSMAVTANLVDSITDGAMDYRDKKMQRRPDSEYYGTLLKRVPVEAQLGSRALFHVSVLREFAIMSWRRLENRALHPRNQTSSLRIFTKK